MEVFKIIVEKDGKWYDVIYAQRTSPTSTLSGSKRCSDDEVAGFIGGLTDSFMKNQTRFKTIDK